MNSVNAFQIFLQDSYGNNVTSGDMRGFDVVVATGSGGLFDFQKVTYDIVLTELKWPEVDSAEEDAYLAANPDKLGAYVYYTGSYRTPTAGISP